MFGDLSVASSSVAPFSVMEDSPSVATRRSRGGQARAASSASPPPPPPQDEYYIPPPPESGTGAFMKKLPPGWTTVTDDNGQIYYWDVITGQTRWTAPDSDQVPPPPNMMAGAGGFSSPQSMSSNIPSGWMSAVDEDGSIYYWNIATGETTWTHPSNQNAPPPPPTMGIQGEKLPPGWTSVIHDDGNLYYWEVHSGKTRWTHPSIAIAQPPPFDSVWKETAASSNPLLYGYPSTRPSSQYALALVSFLLFPPIGLFALIHACQVGHCWTQGRYVDAHFHAQVARGFGVIATLAGIGMWIYILFFSEGGVHNFADWRPKKLSQIDWPWK